VIIVSMIRRVIFWAHLCIGVVAGIAVLIMSITGVLLAFERQVLQFADRDLRVVSASAGAPPRRLSEMLSTVSASAGSTPSGVLIRPESSAAVEFTIGRDRNIYVDPYTGAVLGEGPKTARAFFAAVERWHRAFGEPLGGHGPLRAVAAAANLLFLLLVASGFYLWLPRKWSWTAVRAALLLRPGLRGRARDWNWHNVAGLWSALPLLLITLTGVIISYPWANALLFRLAGSVPPARQESGRPQGRELRNREQGSRQGTSADLDRAAVIASVQLTDWRSMNLRVPGSGDSTVPVTLDFGTGGEVEKRTQVLVDTRTGQVLRETRFADNSLAQRLRSLVRFIHTGEEAGLTGQLIAAAASAGAGLLVWTGLALTLHRWRAWRS
jgi:uncharacterized iron-regulated membrane protein